LSTVHFLMPGAKQVPHFLPLTVILGAHKRCEDYGLFDIHITMDLILLGAPVAWEG